MTAFCRLLTILSVIVTLLLFSGCEKEITIQCHSDTTNLKVGDENIGTLLQGEQKDVGVKAVGKTLVKWTNYDGEAQSETLAGADVEEGAVWHLYHAYGSFDEW